MMDLQKAISPAVSPAELNRERSEEERKHAVTAKRAAASRITTGFDERRQKQINKGDHVQKRTMVIVEQEQTIVECARVRHKYAKRLCA